MTVSPKNVCVHLVNKTRGFLFLHPCLFKIRSLVSTGGLLLFRGNGLFLFYPLFYLVQFVICCKDMALVSRIQ